MTRNWQPTRNPQSRVMCRALLPLAETVAVDAKRSEYGSDADSGRWPG